MYIFNTFSRMSHFIFQKQDGGGKCKSGWSSQVEYLTSCPVCLNLSMELVSVHTKIIDNSTVDKTKPFHYINFSLGLLDYNCLVQIRHFYESRTTANLEKEEKKWFEQLFFDWGKQTMAYRMAVHVKTFFQERVWGKSLGKQKKCLGIWLGKGG